MVRTAQTILFSHAVDKVGAPVRAVGIDQSESSLAVFEQNEFFAENFYKLGRMARQFRHRRDRVPIAPQQFSHRRARFDLCQPLVVFLANHVPLLSLSLSLSLSLLVSVPSSILDHPSSTHPSTACDRSSPTPDRQPSASVRRPSIQPSRSPCTWRPLCAAPSAALRSWQYPSAKNR